MALLKKEKAETAPKDADRARELAHRKGYANPVSVTPPLPVLKEGR